MATEVKLPRLGQGMESGTIVKWLKGEGEPVKKREPLYELDTDKVTQEVEAEADGVLLKIVVDSGEVEVGRTIAFIGSEGEDVPSGNGAAPAAEAESDEAAVEEEDEPQTEGSSAPGMDDQRALGQEAAAATAEAATAAVADAPVRPDGRVKASPLARRLAREKGIDIATLSGSGPEGRIVAEDVERGAVAAPKAAPAAVAAPVRRGRGDRADLDAQDDRAPLDRGLAGAGLPADGLGRHDPVARAARAARRAPARGRDEADRQRPADEGGRGRAAAPPGCERPLHGRQDPALPVRARRHRGRRSERARRPRDPRRRPEDDPGDRRRPSRPRRPRPRRQAPARRPRGRDVHDLEPRACSGSSSSSRC